jgi:hypothetical protein
MESMCIHAHFNCLGLALEQYKASVDRPLRKVYKARKGFALVCVSYNESILILKNKEPGAW